MATLLTGSADQKLIEEWDQKLKACQQGRLNFELQWHKNLAFFFGRQWVQTAKTSGGFILTESPPKDAFRVRHVSNKILRVVRTEVTKMSKEEPEFFCMPDSTEEEDRLAAMAGDAIAESIIYTKYFNKKRTLAAFWASLCGTSFLKNWYNSEKLDIDGLPGRIDFDVVTPFHLFVPNLQATEMEDQPYCIQARTMNPEDVYNEYGIEIKPGTDSVDLITEQRFLTSVGIKNKAEVATKQCYVKEVYVKPCKNFPNGAMFTYGEDKILYVHEKEQEEQEEQGNLFTQGEDGEELFETKGLTGYDHEYPYRHGFFPYVKIDHIMTGMFYGESVVKSLISPQREYNRTRSVMLENRNLAGKPQWWYNPGAFDPRHFNSKPGNLLKVALGFEPPHPLEQPALPPSVSQELEITVRDMDDISSQFEISKGRTPPGVEAASAIAYLSEENDSIFFPTIQSMENAVQETGIQVLSNVYDYWPVERIVRLTSKNQFMEVRQFKKEDLKPRMDFRVVPGSMAPRSIAAKQAFITELMKNGHITPQQGLRYLQMSETNKLYEDLMLDTRHAQRENVTMAQGQELVKEDPNYVMDPLNPVPPTPLQAEKLDPTTNQPVVNQMGQPVMYNVTVNPFDEHQVHVMEHQNFQKSQEYELLPTNIKQIIQRHVDEHKAEIIKERNYIQQDQVSKGLEEETVPPRELESPDGAS